MNRLYEWYCEKCRQIVPDDCIIPDGKKHDRCDTEVKLLVSCMTKNILYFNDIPLLFIATDPVRISYVFMLIDEERLMYYGVMVGDEKLSDFMNGKIDLRTIFQHPEKKDYWEIIDIDNSTYIIHLDGKTKMTEEELPKKGFYI